MSRQDDRQKQEPAGCGPGCSCGTGGTSARTKWVICGLVALAAVATGAVHAARARTANGQATAQDYSTAIPVAVPAETAQAAAEETDAWAAPLKGLAELNQVAGDTEGVFIVLPSGDAARTAAIQKEVSTAATTISGRGSRMGKFLLSQDSQEYASLGRQVGTPAVLAMCKGRSMAAVKDKDVSQGNLLKAFVSASRPSGCGPSACGPGAAGCGPAAPAAK